VESCNSKLIDVIKSEEIGISIELVPEIFERVSIHANISNIEVKINDDNSNILLPVFKPRVWISLQNENKQMDSFYEFNEFTEKNKFSIWAQYSIENVDSLKLDLTYSYIKGNKNIERQNEYKIEIKKTLIFDKLINYK